MENKKDRYFGLSQGDGEIEEQEPGFHKGMLLKKKTSSDEGDTLLASKPHTTGTLGPNDGGLGEG